MEVEYEIRIRGEIGESLLASFEDMEATVGGGETVLRGRIVDQAQLHGLLERVRLLGLELIEVHQLPDGEAPASGTDAA